jgi:polar amino acid transport system permease protein
VDYDFDWSYIWASRLPLLQGLAVTLEVSTIGIALAVAVGVAGAFIRLFGVRGANAIVAGYVELIRNTPILAQLFFIFYGLPELGMKPSPFWSGVLMLTLWGGAYNVESMRGALASVDRGLREAAYSLGLSRVKYFRFIAIPIALRLTLPSVLNTAISMLKNSALLQTVGLAELTFVAVDRASLSYRMLEMFGTIGAIYLALGLGLASAVGRLERRLHQPFQA